MSLHVNPTHCTREGLVSLCVRPCLLFPHLVGPPHACHCAAPTRGGSCVSSSEELERFRDTHQCNGTHREPEQDDGEESSEGRSSDTERVANAEARISASGRESTWEATQAAEGDVKVDVHQLENQEAAVNEIESHEMPTVQLFRRSRRQKCIGPDCNSARHGSEQGNPWHSDGAERPEVLHERHASTIP